MIEKKEIVYEGIPFTTYEVADGNVKPLIYFFHGFTSDREKGIMGRGEILASKGFFVVAMDAHLHGERRIDLFDKLTNEEKFKDFFNIVVRTAEDALLLYDKYLSNNSKIERDNVYAFGVSMGASVSFYLATFMKQLKTVVSLVGSPAFVDFYSYFKTKFNWKNDLIYQLNISYYKALCPLVHFERLEGKKLFMACGDQDQIVPLKFAYELSQKLSATDVIYKVYETGHISTKEMHEDAYQFLLKN